MRESQPSSLRKVLSIAVALVTLLAVTAAVSLLVATSVLHTITEQTAKSVESVRIAEEAEILLLLHARADDPVLRTQLESDLDRHLAMAGEYMTTVREQQVLGEAARQVEDYLQRVPDAPNSAMSEARAFEALERLAELNVERSREAQARANTWDRIAMVAGVGLAVLIVATGAGLVLWLRRRVSRPLLHLAQTMRRFGTGDRAVRADQQGPTELREMSQHFNEMADAIAAQRQAQVAFLGGVAHDLRNPLAALKLAVDMVGPKHELPPESEMRRMLAIVARQIDHLDRMVGDFLDSAKLEAGTLDLQLEPHDVRTIVREAVELFEPAAVERFSVTMPKAPVELVCDAGRITQVITNLLSNAIKYSPATEPIDVTLTEAADAISIEVTDRGLGIPRDDQQRIFEPFRRGSVRSTVPGAGLGLYNVKRMVEAHHGRIEVESIPSVGSTFRVQLPRASAARQAPVHASRIGASRDPAPHAMQHAATTRSSSGAHVPRRVLAALRVIGSRLRRRRIRADRHHARPA